MEYRPQTRLAARRNDLTRRRQALADALAVALFLKTEYGTEVYGFGSLFDESRDFGVSSDIDLAIVDLPKAVFFAASARAQELTEIDLDIVPLEDASALLRETVLTRGVRL